MNTIKVTLDEFNMIWNEKHPSFLLIEKDGWREVEYVPSCKFIVQHTVNKKFYQGCMKKVYNDFLDVWDLSDDDELTEVHQVVNEVFEWEPV